jgi:ornithine cyclodeaminase/alanine dehydrogenase-like protein (mu-crystallin family)
MIVDIIEIAQKQLEAERNVRKLARVTAALRDLQAAQAVVKQLNKRLQEIASADDDVFE